MKRKVALVAVLLGAALLPAAARAAVVVIANRAPRDVTFTISTAGDKVREHTVARGDLLALPVGGPVTLVYEAGGARHTYDLDANAAYFFAETPDGLGFSEIGSSGGDVRRTVAPAPQGKPPAVITLPVKILVDEEEPTQPAVWEARLRKRVAEASAILERHCRVRLEVVEVGTWVSDNEAKDFPSLLRDFESKVTPRPARLAIGFSSQRLPLNPIDKPYLGGTRAPLHPFILLREWYPKSETEKLEVLLHELGHFLGATHSPEPVTVMRPKVGDGRSRVKGYRIGYDPLNTLIMNLVAEDAAPRRAGSLTQLAPATRQRLAQIYREVQRAYPDDATAPKYLTILGEADPERVAAAAPAGPAAPAAPAAAPKDPLAEGARAVVSAINDAAAENRRRREPLRGDALTNLYVRRAADAAAKLPEDQAAGAFLVGLAVAVDDSLLVRNNPLTRALWHRVESGDERDDRLKVLGEPTVHGRHDFAQHFFVSGALTALAGAKAAEAAGILKELFDAEGTSGFSFADLAADLGGIAFANHVIDAPRRLEVLAASFAVADWAIKPDGLTDGLTKEEFAREYGSVDDERFKKAQADIQRRVRELPPYRKAERRRP
jgi:hypothetical protein